MSDIKGQPQINKQKNGKYKLESREVERGKFIILMEQATNNDIFFLCGIDERMGQLVGWNLS